MHDNTPFIRRIVTSQQAFDSLDFSVQTQLTTLADRVGLSVQEYMMLTAIATQIGRLALSEQPTKPSTTQSKD